MIKIIFRGVLAIILILAGIYLLLPGPAEPPPLPESLKSTEPGDTVEIPGLFAYYTNISRSEAIAYYQKYFSSSSFLGLPLLTYRLNHPPEYTWVVIRDTIHSSFIEELVHPFRESLFISGYQPSQDPFLKPGERRADFEFEGKKYSTKVTVLRKDSNPLLRLVIFALAILCLGWLVSQMRKTYEDIRYHR